MRFSASIKVLGILLMIFSLSMVPPIFVSWYYHDGAELSFLTAFLITLLSGVAIWLKMRNETHELKVRDGFLVVVLFWTVLSLFGAVPFLIALYPKLSFTDAFFETVSGLTTTGATVFSHLHRLPRAILYYRLQLHFLGGMGIIVLAVAILPMLGIGGMQLYKAETVGPVKTTKLRPRMAQSAKALWYIYVGLVIICAVSYWSAGMPLFDSIGESFSTISTGGFSMHDSSFAYYDSNTINVIGIIFMLLGATNFGLHFQAIRYRHFSAYLKDPEFKAYLKLLLGLSLVTLITLTIYHIGKGHSKVVHAVFTVVSMATTTGLTTDNFNLWPTFLPYMIMMTALIGGCAASTSGGMKVIRVLLMKEQSKIELRRLVHPQGIFKIKLGEDRLSEQVVQAIWGFAAMYILIFVILLLFLLADNLDIRTAFGALAGCLSNTGAAIGKVSGNFEDIPNFSKWVLTFAMFAGRLEIFTLLVLFTPEYWRK